MPPHPDNISSNGGTSQDHGEGKVTKQILIWASINSSIKMRNMIVRVMLKNIQEAKSSLIGCLMKRKTLPNTLGMETKFIYFLEDSTFEKGSQNIEIIPESEQ